MLALQARERRILTVENSGNFLEAGEHEFPFEIHLEAQNKKPPTFCIIDQKISNYPEEPVDDGEVVQARS